MMVVMRMATVKEVEIGCVRLNEPCGVKAAPVATCNPRNPSFHLQIVNFAAATERENEPKRRRIATLRQSRTGERSKASKRAER